MNVYQELADLIKKTHPDLVPIVGELQETAIQKVLVVISDLQATRISATPDALANTQSIKREKEYINVLNEGTLEKRKGWMEQMPEPWTASMPIAAKKCDCGSASVGSPGHSHWCSLNEGSK